MHQDTYQTPIVTRTQVTLIVLRLWQLGRQRLLCGDSGESKDVDRLLDGAQINLLNSNPPQQDCDTLNSNAKVESMVHWIVPSSDRY